MGGSGGYVFLTCVANGNTYMSHDTVNRRTKGPTTECGPPLVGGRHRIAGRRRDVGAQFWLVAAPSVSLPRGSSSHWSSCSHHRTVDPDHAEDTGQCRARSAQLFGSQRIDAWRHCRACHLQIPEGNAQAWLTGARERIARSVSITPLIVCSRPSCNKSTRFWSPTRSAF